MFGSRVAKFEVQSEGVESQFSDVDERVKLFYNSFFFEVLNPVRHCIFAESNEFRYRIQRLPAVRVESGKDSVVFLVQLYRVLLRHFYVITVLSYINITFLSQNLVTTYL